ncbi:hypothetical protein B7486_39740 [cyanobacterium TDX16]|nr:hypothetical protein B7486_39740 [cyanobacterium TDX16]
MLSTIEQFVFTSFDDIGFASVYSKRFPVELQHVIQSDLIARYWDTYQPPPDGFVGVYLHQVNDRQTLFGWLYDEAGDTFGRGHVPYFLIYFSDSRLERRLLDDMMWILERGPLQKIQRAAKPLELEQIVVDSVFNYTSQGLGVSVPRSIRLECYSHLRAGSRLHFFTPPIYTSGRTSATVLDVSLSRLMQRSLAFQARYYTNFNTKRLSTLFVRTRSLASKDAVSSVGARHQDRCDDIVVEQKTRRAPFLPLHVETLSIIAPIALFVVLMYVIAFAPLLRPLPSEIEAPSTKQSQIGKSRYIS